MKKITKKLPKMSLILMFLLLNFSASYSQNFDYISAKEGLETAIGQTTVSNPELVNILTFNGEFEVGIIGQVKGEFVFEGENIGKANIWIYTFKSGIDEMQTCQVGVCKLKAGGIIFGLPINFDFAEYGVNFSFHNSLDTESLADSDEFAKKLAEDAFYNQMQNACIGDCFSIIGVGAAANQYYCLQPEEKNWMRIVISDGDFNFCCKTPYNDINSLTCSEYSGISEEENEFSLSIFPVPATKSVTISNQSDLAITSIELFDIVGNKIYEFEPNITELNISNFPAGNYSICFVIGNVKIYRSLVIM